MMYRLLGALTISALMIVAADHLSSDASQLKTTELEHDYTHDHVDLGFCAIPPDPSLRLYTQPDGSTFEAGFVGSPAVLYLQTAEGFTIERDEEDGYYKYLVADAAGDLLLSDIVVHAPAQRSAREKAALQGLNKRVRYTGKALRDRVASYQAAFTTPQTGQQRQLITGAFPSSGVRRALLLLIDYPDQGFTHPTGSLVSFCNTPGYNVGGQQGSFRDYFLDQSYGTLTVDTDVSGWYTAANPVATYGVQSMSSRQFLPAVDLVREAVDAAEANGLDFSLYDNDNDGDVDVVMVIHSGMGAEQSGNPDDIWSHRWVLSANSQQVTYDGVFINDYIIQGETRNAANDLAYINVFSHEFGHALGLPDLYDTNGGSAGIGRWGMMAGGTWNGGGQTPAQMSAWCKQEMGWTTPTLLDATVGGAISNLASSANSPQSYRINTTVPDEYYLIEVRDATKWDGALPGYGVLIYHIDESAGSNQNPANYWVNVEQADGDNDLNNDINSGDTGDPWPGSSAATVFACSTNPNTDTYAGGVSDVGITSIAYAGGLGAFAYGDCNLPCTVTALAAGNQTFDCATNSFSQEITVTSLVTPTSGTLDVTLTVNGQAYTNSAAVASSPQTITVAGLPIGAGSIDAVASFSADAACTLSEVSISSAPTSCPGANDDICNALDITAQLIAGSLIQSSNLACTVQANEPAPEGGSCNATNRWCNSTLHNSAWYKFTAPASGSINLVFPSGSPDLQLAIWEPENTCSDLFDPSKRWLVAANDDGGPGYAPELTGISCLIPGKTYFIQLDGYSAGVSGAFSMTLSDAGLSCTTAPTTTAGCATTAQETSEGWGEWIHLKDANGEVVASVNDRLNDLGTITTSYQLNASGTSRQHTTGEAFMDRDWGIEVATQGAASLRLYFTPAEWAALQTAGGISTLGELSLKRFAGQACGQFSGLPDELYPSYTLLQFDGVNHLVQFEIPGFSSFTLQSAAGALPVELTSFSGSEKGASNELTWTTANEVNVSHFELERQDDRGAWTVTAHQPSKAANGAGANYTLVDRQPAPTSYYRLRSVDFDGSEQLSEVIVISRQARGDARLVAMPNPVGREGELYLSGFAPQAEVQVFDAQGRVVASLAAGDIQQQGGLLPLTDLPAGVYRIHAISAGEVQTVSVVVR